jgi:hypothetical protein
MERDRVVYARAYALRLQMLHHCIAATRANDVKVIDMTSIGWLEGCHDIAINQQLVIKASMGAPGLSPFLNVRQLGSENSCLEPVHALAESNFFMLILGRAPVIAQLTHLCQQSFIVASHRACIAVSAQVLTRIKAETRQVANAATSLSIVLSRVRLCRVFDQPQVMALCDLAQRPHLCRLAIKMDWENRLRAWRDGIFDSIRIDVIGLWVNVYEDRPCAGQRDSFCGGDERIGASDYFVPGPNPDNKKSQLQCSRAGGNSDSATRADARSERLLEVSDFFAEDEAPVVDDALDGRINLRLDVGVLCFQINERYLNCSVSFTGKLLYTVCGQFAHILYNAGGIADNDLTVWHVTDNDGARSHQRVATDGHTGQQGRIGPDL